MATPIAGIWSQVSAAHNLSKAQSTASSATGTSSSSDSDSSTISANDFLTLLVTEMQNQDPTADTDPNEYINQLVQVNSLEQLISINQTLTTDSTANPSSGAVKAPGTSQVASILNASQPAALSALSTIQQGVADTALPHLAGGNLTVPENHPAAQRVARSLTTAPNAL